MSLVIARLNLKEEILSVIIQAQEGESHHSHTDVESKSAELMRIEGEWWLVGSKKEIVVCLQSKVLDRQEGRVSRCIVQQMKTERK